MTKRTLALTAGLLLYSCARSFAQVPGDAVAPADIIWHVAPEVGGWQPTVRLDGVEFRSGSGIHPLVDRGAIGARWPARVPAGWSGPLTYTLWVGVQVEGRWHMGGFILFWLDRDSTGANWFEPATDGPRAGQSNWVANWAYNSTWGPMERWVPTEGAEVLFMLAAGGNRFSEVFTVAERSNIVKVRARRAGVERAELPPPVVVGQPPPPPGGQPPPIPTPYDAAFQAWAREFAEYVRATNAHQNAQLASILQQLEALNIRHEEVLRKLAELQARPQPQGGIGTMDRTAIYSGLAAAIVAVVRQLTVQPAKALTLPVRLPARGLKKLFKRASPMPVY